MTSPACTRKPARAVWPATITRCRSGACWGTELRKGDLREISAADLPLAFLFDGVRNESRRCLHLLVNFIKQRKKAVFIKFADSLDSISNIVEGSCGVSFFNIKVSLNDYSSSSDTCFLVAVCTMSNAVNYIHLLNK